LPLNLAVNNDGTLYPRAFASHSGKGSNLAHLNDGNYWYHTSPPNRWHAGGSPNDADWCGIDFGTPRTLREVKLYFLEGEGITPPRSYELEFWDGKKWARIPDQTRVLKDPAGRRANTVRFPALKTTKLRAVLTHQAGSKSGLSEFEAWGDADLPLAPVPMPEGNLAYNPTGKGFPKATASHTDRFGANPMAALDGKISFRPSPFNRWTSYESPNATDWLEIDFGAEKQVGRIELGIYDDHGGVQAPARYDVQFWDGKEWKEVSGAKKTPAEPIGGQFNEVRFDAAKTTKVRLVFTNRGKARSGVTEVLVWAE
jgi:hypothetical protein